MTTPVLTSVAMRRSGKIPFSSARKFSDTAASSSHTPARLETGARPSRPPTVPGLPGDEGGRRAGRPSPVVRPGYRRLALSDDWLDGKGQSPYELWLSRGHLSRPACSHVKQIAKRPGTRTRSLGTFPRPGFLLAKGGPDVRVPRPQSRNAACSRRYSAFAVR